MDVRDHRILVELMGDPFASYAEIGRRVGMPGSTVGNRVERLRARGILCGFEAMPAPQLLGRHVHTFIYEPQEPRADQADAALEVPDVVWARVLHDERVTATLLTNAQDPDPPAGFDDLFDSTPTDRLRIRLPDPEHGASLEAEDWLVIEAVMDDPLRSITTLADETGLSKISIRRRRGRLLSSGCLYVFPLVEIPPGSRVLAYNLLVELEEGADRAEVARAVPDAVPKFRLEEPRGLVLFGRADSHVDALARSWKLGDRPDVRSTILAVPSSTRSATGRVKGWVRERLATSKPPQE